MGPGVPNCLCSFLCQHCKWQCCIKHNSKYINSYYANIIKKITGHTTHAIFIVLNPDLSLWVDLSNVFHRRKKVLLTKELPGVENGSVLVPPCTEPLILCYSSPGAFIFFWENNTRISIIFCVFLAFVAQHRAIFVSQVQALKKGICRCQELSWIWEMERESRNTSCWVLTGSDKSHQGCLREVHIYLTDETQTLLGTKGNSRFVRAEKLKLARCQMALYPLTGSWQLFLGTPGPGEK